MLVKIVYTWRTVELQHNSLFEASNFWQCQKAINLAFGSVS